MEINNSSETIIYYAKKKKETTHRRFGHMVWHMELKSDVTLTVDQSTGPSSDVIGGGGGRGSDCL